MSGTFGSGFFGSGPFGGSFNTFEGLKFATRQNKHTMFRRLYFKRRNQTGYESNWQQIDSDKIKSWGSVSYALDDIKINNFKQSGVTVKVRNDDGYFNEVDDYKSFFFNYFTIYGAW